MSWSLLYSGLRILNYSKYAACKVVHGSAELQVASIEKKDRSKFVEPSPNPWAKIHIYWSSPTQQPKL